MNSCEKCGQELSQGQKCNCDQLKEGSDYYLENGLMVFTKEYLLKRGYCCNNSCRNCPWLMKPKK